MESKKNPRAIPKLKKLTRLRHGQAVILYALLIPVMFLFIGLGLDLGWYYLSVSRLQNAADAAAIAGAQKILEDKVNFARYEAASLVHYYPSQATKYIAGETEKETVEGGNRLAANYALKNLSLPNESWTEQSNDYYVMTDAWSNGGNPEVTMNSSIYEDEDGLYFVVKLSKDVRHLLMSGWFNDMNAPVTAIAMLSKLTLDSPYEDSTDPSANDPQTDPFHRGNGAGIEEPPPPEGTDILAEMYRLEDISVVRNWEWQDWYQRDSVTYTTSKPGGITGLTGTTVTPRADYKAAYGIDIYSGNWNSFENVAEGSHVRYREGDFYRSETLTVRPGSRDELKGSSKKYSEAEVDSLNLDLNPDLLYVFKDDWDIGDSDIRPPGNKTFLSIQHSRSSKNDSTNENTFKLRIHATFNFETPYKVRKEDMFDKMTNPEDVLYIRIESEPIKSLPFIKNREGEFNVFSTVRQIFININQSNMASQYRPIILFYAGPEKIYQESPLRYSQPVILNLNADARVILFAPNSPVVINGNENKLRGFVIAEKFVRLTTEKDYYVENGRYYDSAAKTKEFFLIDETNNANIKNEANRMFIDEYGNVQTKPLSSNSTRDPDYKDNLERPLRLSVIEDPKYEKVYKMNTAFNIDTGDYNRTSSYYDSFRLFNNIPNMPSLKRNIYTYLDSYTDNNEDNSVDMFFTRIRAGWIDWLIFSQQRRPPSFFSEGYFFVKFTTYY